MEKIEIERDTIEQVKGKLRGYLQDMGVTFKGGNMSCPIPDCHHEHGDVRMSCRFCKGTDDKAIYCFTGHRSADIFVMAHLREGLPIGRDPRFYTVTVPTLAERYGIDCPKTEISQTDRDRITMEKAYQDAAFAIHTCSEDLTDILKKRGWTNESVRKFQLGRTDYPKYLSAMERFGWDSDYLDSIDLAGSSFASTMTPEHLTFPIKNDAGQVAGFVTRSLNHEQTGETKYKNSKESVLYQKSRILYNLCRCSPKAPLYIVEGYTDAVTMDAFGYHNTCALGGTALTDKQADMLLNLGYRDLILCLDTDPNGAGTRAAVNAIRLLNRTFLFRVQVRELPFGPDNTKEDPDSFLNRLGKTVFEDLPFTSAFGFLLKQEHKTITADQIYEVYVPMIIEVPSAVRRGSMIKDIASLSGLHEEDIRSDVELRMHESSRIIEYERGVLTDRLRKEIYKSPAPHILITETATKLKALGDTREKFDPFAQEIASATDKRDRYIHQQESEVGFNLPNFKIFARRFNGIPKSHYVFTIGGHPQHGKSTLARNLALELARYNNDVQAIYIPFDDTASRVHDAWLIQLSQVPVKRIGVRSALSPEEKQRWDQAYDELLSLGERLHVPDPGREPSVENVERIFKFYIRKFPNLMPVVFVDSLHNLDQGGSAKEGVAHNIGHLKAMCKEYDCPLFLVSQINKETIRPSSFEWAPPMARRPDPQSLSETRTIHYDSDAILMIHCDLQIYPGTHLVWEWTDHEGRDIRMPYAEVYAWKNRITADPTAGWEDSFFFKLNRVTSTLQEVTYGDLPKQPEGRTPYGPPNPYVMHGER